MSGKDQWAAKKHKLLKITKRSFRAVVVKKKLYKPPPPVGWAVKLVA
jgi:hypothetical protein